MDPSEHVPDAHYEDPRLAELYDLGNGWSVDRGFYLALAHPGRRRVLDLGCGTGLLCDAFAARGHDVTGVDPAAAMLAVARRKPHGGAIEWVRSSAQRYASSRRFDLIVMTGHAFQVLLDDADVRAAFAVMRCHLAPGGTIAFESRNPAVDWPARWDYDVVLDAPGGAVREARRFVRLESGRMTFELRFQLPDEELVTTSELRFWSRAEIDAHLDACGLAVDELRGGWHCSGFDPDRSDEMIFIVRRMPDDR